MNAMSGLKKSWVASVLMLARLLAVAADGPPGMMLLGRPDATLPVRPDLTLLDDTYKNGRQVLVQDIAGGSYVRTQDSSGSFPVRDRAGFWYLREQDPAGGFKYVPVSPAGFTQVPNSTGGFRYLPTSAGGFTDFASGRTRWNMAIEPNFGPRRLVENWWPQGVSVTVVTNPPGGIGLLIGDGNDHSRAVYTGPIHHIHSVKRVVPGTPASKAGVCEGDVIVAVDGQPITGVELHDVALRLRGEIGSEVEITVSRPGQPQPIKLKMRREAVVVPSDDFGL